MAEMAWEHPKVAPVAQADLHLPLRKTPVAIPPPPLEAPVGMVEMALELLKAGLAATAEQHLPEVIQESFIRAESLRLLPRRVGWGVPRACLL